METILYMSPKDEDKDAEVKLTLNNPPFFQIGLTLVSWVFLFACLISVSQDPNWTMYSLF